MSKYYENMPEDFRKAVETIKQYCQHEDCDEENCKDCQYPLSIIRRGDEYPKESESQESERTL